MGVVGLPNKTRYKIRVTEEAAEVAISNSSSRKTIAAASWAKVHPEEGVVVESRTTIELAEVNMVEITKEEAAASLVKI